MLKYKKRKNIKTKKHLSSLTFRLLFIYKITPVFFGDRLLLQVVVLVDTTNFWSCEDTSCAEYCGNGVIFYHINVWCFSVIYVPPYTHRQRYINEDKIDPNTANSMTFTILYFYNFILVIDTSVTTPRSHCILSL